MTSPLLIFCTAVGTAPSPPAPSKIMPEYAELHSTAHLCADAARGQTWTSVTVDTQWSLPCSIAKQAAEIGDQSPMVTLPGTEGWGQGFEMCARHRGKEVCLALRPLDSAGSHTTPTTLPAPSHSWCPTCAAVACDNEGQTPPLCAGHREACVVQTVRREDSKHLGRRFWSCAKDSRRERCCFFRWASPTHRSKALDFFPDADVDSGDSGLLLITMRRGMHGRCVLLRADEPPPLGVHLRFVRSDGAVLCFVDSRVRIHSHAVWNFGWFGGSHRRSPDPVYEYAQFRTRVLALLTSTPPVRDAEALLDGPVCELLLDQRLFNGVGNYLRAEILDRAGICPFERARPILERAAAATPGSHAPHPDLLRATRDVLAQAVESKGRDWLNVYRKRYAKHEVDGLGREVWYRRGRGPLPSTMYEAEGAWDSLFVARLPALMDRDALKGLCARFGAVEHVTFNGARGYAFVRFQDVGGATAAQRALNHLTILGNTLHVRFKRRLRKVRAAAAVAVAGDEAVLDEEDLMAEEDVESAALAAAAPCMDGVAPLPSGNMCASAASRCALLSAADEDDDEWDEPVVIVQPEPHEVATKPQGDAFSRSLRSFRAAGQLGGGAGDTTTTASIEVDGDVDGMSTLVGLARSYHDLATRELKRFRAV